MSILAVATILIALTIVIYGLPAIIYTQQKRKIMSQILNHFSKVGSDYDLSFSSQEILKQCVFGLDGLHRKILIIKTENEQRVNKVIDLDEVRSCSVKRTFGSINAGDLKKKKLEQHLQKIVLQFEFSNNKLPIEIPFYDHGEYNIYQLSHMEQKAKHWQAILSKLICPIKNIA
jgi:hypothetical protein